MILIKIINKLKERIKKALQDPNSMVVLLTLRIVGSLKIPLILDLKRELTNKIHDKKIVD